MELSTKEMMYVLNDIALVNEIKEMLKPELDEETSSSRRFRIVAKLNKKYGYPMLHLNHNVK